MRQNISLRRRSCDTCRKKKIRCDGPEIPGNHCTNCRNTNIDCTYEESAIKKKPGPSKSYVESLEVRLKKAEHLLRLLVPDGDFTRALGVEVDPDTWAIHSTDALAPSSMVSDRTEVPVTDGKTQKDFMARILRNFDTDIEIPDDDEHIMGPGMTQLSNNLKNMHIDLGEYRFFGKSSGVMLVQTALNLKTEHTTQTKNAMKNLTPFSIKDQSCPLDLMPRLRKEFWSTKLWERNLDAISDPAPQYQFPEPDLMASLVKLYFENMNTFWPLLHRPTLESQWKDGLHNREHSFSATLLLVVAVGARFSDDPRVFTGDDRGHSAGWKYFSQVAAARRSLIHPPGLYDLQFCALSTMFLLSSSAPQTGWVLAGIGIRMAQDIGAHRKRKKVSNIPIAEDELMKRVFWVLVSLDRMLSSAIGRPTAIQEEDFDIDYLAECDDEFWNHPDPSQAWKQPERRPSVIATFNTMLRLNRILAQVHRTIYSINKQKVKLSLINEEWEECAVTEFDSLLNRWVDTIPSHLKWDPHNKNDTWFQQSAWLHTSYYYIQILVHRPFIASLKAPKNLVWSSFAICTNAAKSTAKVLDCVLRRIKGPFPHLQAPAFTSAIVLLLAIWGGKREDPTSDPKIEIENVLMCMNYLKRHESRWHTAGRVWDIINELASMGDISLPNTTPVYEEEVHSHHSESSIDFAKGYPRYPSSASVATSSSYSFMSSTPSFLGQLADISSGSSSNPVFNPPGTGHHSLPMYTTELGQSPFDPINFFTQPTSTTSAILLQQQQQGQGMHAPQTAIQHEGPALAAQFQNGFQYGSQSEVAEPSIFTTPVDRSGATASSSQSFPSAHPSLDNTVDLFANPPLGFDQVMDWGPYLTSFWDFANVGGDPAGDSDGSAQRGL